MIRINLIYDKLDQAVRSVKREFVLFGFIFLVTIALIVTSWSFNAIKIRGLSAENQKTAVEKEEYSKISKKIKDYQRSKEDLTLVIDSIISLLELQKGPTRVIENIGTRLPGKIWLTSISERSGSIKIEGLSFSNPGVALFMDNLKNGGLFSQVELIGIDQVEMRGEVIKKFSLRLILGADSKGNG